MVDSVDIIILNVPPLVTKRMQRAIDALSRARSDVDAAEAECRRVQHDARPLIFAANPGTEKYRSRGGQFANNFTKLILY